MSILIFLTILLSPLYIIRWSYFGVLPTTVLELLLWLTILVWLIIKFRKRDFSWPRTVFDLPILLLLFAATVSLFITPDLRGGLGVWKAYFVEPTLFYYLVVDFARSSDNKILFQISNIKYRISNLVVSGLVGAGLWVSILGILQTTLGLFIMTPHQADRAHATFNNGNALALFIGPIIFLLLGLIFDHWGKGVKGIKGLREGLVEIAVLIVLTVTIFLTKSMGGVVGLFTGVVFFITAWLIRFKLRKTQWLDKLIRLIFFGIVMAFLLFLLNISRFVPQVENPWQRPGDTVSVRFCLWEGTRNLLFDKPIFGAGLSAFKELYSNQYYTCDAEALEYPHNWILNFWTETGLLGLIAFIWLLGSWFKLLQGSTLGLIAAVVYWLVHGLVDVPYFKNDLALEFWTIMALGWVTSLASASEHPPEAPN